MQKVAIVKRAGEEPIATFTTHEKLLALAEQICQEGVAIIYRTWPHAEFDELVELYRAPSAGWQAPATQPTEPF